MRKKCKPCSSRRRGGKQFAALNSRKIPIPVYKPGVDMHLAPGILLPARPRPNIGQWAIQIGAYRSVRAAEFALSEASKRLPVLLVNASAALTPVEMKRGNILYRARFLGLDKSAATQACRSLKAVTMPCAVMPNSDYRLARAAAS